MLKQIEIKNFKSVGNKSFTFDFTKSNFTLIKGKSGVGKTLLLSAIYFVLYGKNSDLKGSSKSAISINELVNDINKKEAVVKLTLLNGISIIRGIKPNIFEIQDKDGNNLADKSAKKIDQDYLVNDILNGVTADVFMSTVYLSAKAISVPFLYMSKTDRKNYIEKILDLRIIYYLNENLKPIISTNKLDIVTYNKEIELIQQSIDNEKFNLNKQKIIIQEQQAKLKNFKEDKETKLNSIKKDINELDKDLSGLVFKEDMIQGDILSKKDELHPYHIEEFNMFTSELRETEEKLNTLKNMMINKKGEKDNFLKVQENFSMCKGCPTLPQITGSYSFEDYDKFQDKSKDAYTKLNLKIKKIKDNLSKVKEMKDANEIISTTIRDLEQQHNNILQGIKSTKESIKLKEELYETVENEQEPVIQEYSEEYLTKLNNDLDTTQNKLDIEYNSSNDLDILKKTINDKDLKGKALESYLPIFEEKLNLLLERFFENMSFNLQAELTPDFELVFYKHNKVISVYSLSSGQNQLVSLAVTFSFLHILNIKHKSSIGMLMIDELLDGSMSNSLLFVIQYLRELSQEQNIIVISHDSSIFEEFDKVYEVTTKSNFSNYKEI